MILFSNEFMHHFDRCNRGQWMPYKMDFFHDRDASLKDDFYTIKSHILRRFGDMDGYDVQKFWKIQLIWKDVPDGSYRQNTTSAKPHYTGKWSKDLIAARTLSTHTHLLERYMLQTESGPRMYHRPSDYWEYQPEVGEAKRSDEPLSMCAGPIRNTIYGLVEYEPVPAPNDSLKYVLSFFEKVFSGMERLTVENIVSSIREELNMENSPNAVTLAADSPNTSLIQ